MAGAYLPKYQDLSLIEKTGDRHAWGLFGKHDHLGRINLLTPARVLRALGTVTKGKVFNLSLPLDMPNPPLVQGRESYNHTTLYADRNTRDDKLDNFWLQASSQWDSLQHIRYREFGFYNGLQSEDVESGALGIDRLAEHGIVGRGVLLDIPGYLQKQGIALAPTADTPFEADLLESALKAEGVTTEPGDILLLRTGWMKYYLALSSDQRAKLPRMREGLDTPGLQAARETAAWLWDHGFAAAAGDNPALEDTPGSPDVGYLHRRLIPLLGMPIGELWNLEALAADCAADKNYTCLVVSVPLNLPGGVGSPANAIALK